MHPQVLGGKRDNIMGDRRMAEIKVTDGSIFFYTHWYGSELPKMAEIALKDAQPRIGDDPYAMRRVLDSLLRETRGRDTENGTGIMLGPNAEDSYNGDGASVVIDLVNNTCTVTGER